MIKLINLIPYLEYIKGFQDTPQQADDLQMLINTIENTDSTFKIIATDPNTQDEEMWDMQMQ